MDVRQPGGKTAFKIVIWLLAAIALFYVIGTFTSCATGRNKPKVSASL